MAMTLIPAYALFHFFPPGLSSISVIIIISQLPFLLLYVSRCFPQTYRNGFLYIWGKYVEAQEEWLLTDCGANVFNMLCLIDVPHGTVLIVSIAMTYISFPAPPKMPCSSIHDQVNLVLTNASLISPGSRRCI